MKDKAFLNKLRTEKFDVGLAEFVDPLAFATFHRLAISTTVVTTSFGLYSILIKYFGVPHPIGHPGFKVSIASVNSSKQILEADSTPLEGLEMGIWQRANNLYLLLRSNWYFEEGLNQVVGSFTFLFKILSKVMRLKVKVKAKPMHKPQK